MALIHELRLFFIAAQFLTRAPIPRWVGFEPDWLHASARYFPAVGSVVGLWGGAVFWVAHPVFGPWVAAFLSIAATLWCTGAFHEDGWADTCDALGGAASRERALEIMKDSRIGAYGAMGLVVMLGLKASVLASLPPGPAWIALVWAHTVSRAAAVSLIHFLPYAGDVAHAKAKPLAYQVARGSWGVACGWVLALGCALCTLCTVWAWGRECSGAMACSLAAAVMMSVVCARWFLRRLGGVTGDTLGATQQLTEAAILLTCLAFARQSWFAF